MATLPKLLDLDDFDFDPFEEEKRVQGSDINDPYPAMHQLLAKGPVQKGAYREMFSDIPDTLSGQNQYIVLGYDAVLTVFRDFETFTNRDAFIHTLGRSFGRTVSVMDAPEHTRYRRIFQKAFLPQIIVKWGETIVDPVVDNLMAGFVDRGEADLVEEFTHHYPFQVIYRQLLLDEEQSAVFHKLAVAQQLTRINMPEGDEASLKLGSFFQGLVTMRRENPVENDLVSHLATIEADGERLPDEVIVSFLRQLINAGGDTTYRGTSNLLVGLLTNPDQYAAVAADRSLIPLAIEEALRWEGPVLTTPRYVAKDTVLAGVPLPQGAILNVMIGSANRDPSKFEKPDEFNLFRTRTVSRPVPFAAGPHVCIGQHLARVEMTRALTAIFDRLPNLRLDPDKPAPNITGFRLRVPEHIHVKFG